MVDTMSPMSTLTMSALLEMLVDFSVPLMLNSVQSVLPSYITKVVGRFTMKL